MTPPDTESVPDLDATAQAALVRRGEATPAELVEAAIDRIERLDPPLNAVVTRMFDQARSAVRAGSLPPGPFTGVPILVKDFGAPTAGDPYSGGTRLLRRHGYRAPADSGLVARLRAAGFVILGRTNTAELGQLGTTEPLAWGPARNPWQPSHTPGGSSGGSAAAVAAGMVAVAHGNDGLGSLRIPASACGLVGLKPSRGRISPVPAPESLGGFAAEGVLTRTVRDTAALLDVLAGTVPGDPYRASAPPGRYAELAGARPPRLRIGVSPAPAGAPCHPACRDAVAGTAAVLERIGHRVEEAEPAALADPRLPDLVAVRTAASLAAQLDDWERRLGAPVTPDDVEPVTWQRAQRGRLLSAAQLAGALAELQLLARQLLSWWEGYDLLLCPTMAQPPPQLGVIPHEPSDPTITFTVPANVTGQPAISVPAALGDDGLPIGVQLVAGPDQEHTLLQVAGELSEAQPWHRRRPPIHA